MTTVHQMQEKGISTQEYQYGYDNGFAEGRYKGYKAGYRAGWNDGYNTEKGQVPKEQVNTFPKHLKTDKEFLEKLQKSKDGCMVWIDFEKIHSVMQHLDWKWVTGDNARVPSIVELVLFAQKQINTAVQGFLENGCNEYFASSGGFKASVKGFADGFCRVTLEFIVSDWDSEIQGGTGEEE